MSERAVPAFDALAHVLLLAGRLMLAHGADTDHVQGRIVGTAAKLDCDIELYVSSERLLVTLGDGAAFRTRLGHPIGSMGVDAKRLTDVEAVLTALSNRSITVDQASRRLDAISVSQSLRGKWVVVPAVAATAAALCRLFEGSWPVVTAALLAGLVGTALRRIFARMKLNAIASTFLNAVASALAAICFLRTFSADPPTLCLVAAGMILVPGVPLINGVTDLVFGHASMSLARLSSSLAAVLGISCGLCLVGLATGAVLPIGQGPGVIAVWEDLIFSAVAAFGFAMLFNVPGRAVPFCMAGGAAVHGGRTWLAGMGLDITIATFVCALGAGILGCVLGRRLKLPRTIFVFPMVVAMIPGSYAFRSAIGALQLMNDGRSAAPFLLVDTAAAGTSALVMTVAIGVGICIGFAGTERLFPARPASANRSA